ncbi:unnamed protein product [Rhodiola kirilowii]
MASLAASTAAAALGKSEMLGNRLNVAVSARQAPIASSPVMDHIYMIHQDN